MSRRLYVATPSYKPVGGVIKVLDYVQHARSDGWDVTIACPKGSDPDSPVWTVGDLGGLLDDEGVDFVPDWRIAPGLDDAVLISWPTHYDDIVARLPPGFHPDRVIHLVQNTRHANPTFAGGFAVRLLRRRMTRIFINEQVLEACRRHLNPVGQQTVIPLGHRTDYFARERSGPISSPIRVGYTTWKSDVGDRTAALLADEPFEFEAIREPAGWEELWALYHSVDVFLCTPNPQEGFYLPGLEAMAASNIVVTPDVEGNMAYCTFGENCIDVPFDDAEAYANVLRGLLETDLVQLDDLREAGRATGERHRLERERADVTAVLRGLPEHAAVAPPPRARGRDDQLALLVGIPRSGSTLAVRLLDGLAGVVALDEPLRPSELADAQWPSQVARDVIRWMQHARRRAIDEGVVPVKAVEGEATTDYFGNDELDDSGLRRDRGVHTEREIERPSGDHLLVVKDLSMSTALLDEIDLRCHVVGLVRNPLSVLASWLTCDLPMNWGRAPHAEWFDSALEARLDVMDDVRARQLVLLDWWFRRLADVIPDRVVRYEDVIATGGAALAVVTPLAADLAEPLESRNANPLYRSLDIAALRDDLLQYDGAWKRWYSDEAIVSIADELIVAEDA